MTIEEMLVDYYKKRNRIEYLKMRYETLSSNINETEQCISTTKHTLEVLLPSQQYGGERVSTSKSGTSPQERALLKSEERMEERIRLFYEERQECLLERYELENECEKVSVMFSLLNEEEEKICQFKYKDKMSFTAIGYELNMDRVTVRRRLIVIHKKMSEELSEIA